MVVCCRGRSRLEMKCERGLVKVTESGKEREEVMCRVGVERVGVEMEGGR